MGKITNYLKLIRRLPGNVEFLRRQSDVEIQYDLKNPKVIMGKFLAELNSKKENIENFSEVEFQVFSQWGDDGIIQYLINKVEIANKVFIEFGVENYRESNTRFLLINNNWSGLVMDGLESNINYIKNDPISWAHELHSWPVFITRENINERIGQFLKLGYSRDIGLLSIDLDGNDYWIWQAIDVILPVIVIVEYNSLYGDDNAYTVPYDADFFRLKDGNIILNYGASLVSLCDLAENKGYDFIGCNSAGNNAYFLRKDKNLYFKKKSPKEGFVNSKFNEMKNKDGSWIMGNDRLLQLKGRTIFNTRTNSTQII
jgi:hypothetical protein